MPCHGGGGPHSQVRLRPTSVDKMRAWMRCRTAPRRLPTVNLRARWHPIHAKDRQQSLKGAHDRVLGTNLPQCRVSDPPTELGITDQTFQFLLPLRLGVCEETIHSVPNKVAALAA